MFIFSQTLADYTTPIKTLKNPYIETTSPELTPDFSQNIQVWKEKLPEQDRWANEYIVIPSRWLVMPIVFIPETNIDYWKVRKGQNIEVNSYLQNGALSYPGEYQNNFWEQGNKVILGHSSYFKKDIWRYKTHFQAIINLEPKTEIWIYKKNVSNGSFTRYIYQVFASFETTPKDNSVLDSDDQSTITLITCTPIGWIQGRWIVQAWFIEKIEEKTLSDILPALSAQLETDMSLWRMPKKTNTLEKKIKQFKRYIQSPVFLKL